ncbi:MAG: hypothetical protein QM703_22905 [Gemmatales bacterium]
MQRAKPSRKTRSIRQLGVPAPSKDTDIDINYDEMQLKISLPPAAARELINRMQLDLTFRPKKPVKIVYELERV